MSNRILIAYATKHGGTAEISEKIGEVLREAGLSAEVLAVDEVGDVSPYRAVVLGSAVYIGRWRKPAAQFLKANEEALAEKEVWLFSSGPTGEGDPEELLDGWRLPERLQSVVERIEPRDIQVFHGVLDEEKINIVERWVVKNVKAPLGDFRDWDAISSWARSIADELREEPRPSAPS
jgi:menaquinone-dependent protoporphyrinogen oxidase